MRAKRENLKSEVSDNLFQIVCHVTNSYIVEHAVETSVSVFCGSEANPGSEKEPGISSERGSACVWREYFGRGQGLFFGRIFAGIQFLGD